MQSKPFNCHQSLPKHSTSFHTVDYQAAAAAAEKTSQGSLVAYANSRISTIQANSVMKNIMILRQKK